MAKRKKKTVTGAMAGAVAGLKDSVIRAEIAVVRAGNKAVKAVQDRVDAGRRKAASKKKAAKKAVSKTKRVVRKAAKKVAKKATKRSKRR